VEPEIRCSEIPSVLRVLIVPGSEQAYRPSQRKYAGWLRTTACVALFAFSACSTAATIERRGWPDYRGTIESSDSDSVHVRGGDGTLYRVPRSDIVDIHHPGKMSLFIGAVLLGLAVSMAMLPSRNGEDYTLVAVGAGCAFGIPGAILAINGATKYAQSKFAANNFEKPTQPPLPLLPKENPPTGPASDLGPPVPPPGLSSDGFLPPPPYPSPPWASKPAAVPQPSAPTAPPPSAPAQPTPADRPMSPPP
jgi:hypothetical protein